MKNIGVLNKLNEQELKLKIIGQAGAIAKSICNGKDVELRKSINGISIAEVSKKVIYK